MSAKKTLEEKVDVVLEKVDVVFGKVDVLFGKVDMLFGAVISLQEQVSAIQEDLRTKYATKDDLLELKEELLAEIRPIARAVDKDALTILNHERRIRVLEKQMA